jgi:hypothetical protein
MSWKRVGKKSYYYWNRRENGRVVSTYLRGDLGQSWAGCQETKNEREKDFRDHKRLLNSWDSPIRDLHREVDRFVALAMVGAGYHKPRRQWRKLRMGTLPATTKVKAPANGEEVERLFYRASRGDKTCREEVRALLDCPDRGPCLIDGVGSMANMVRVSLVEQIAGKDIFLQEALPLRLEHMHNAIAGPDPSPLEALLAETIVIDWLYLYRHQSLVTRIQGVQLDHLDFLGKMVDKAHRRFMKSIETMARIRRCAIPNLSAVFIAQSGMTQINAAAE